MTTEELIETFVDEGMRAFKKERRHSEQARRLDRHEPVVLGNTEVTCWHEFVLYKMSEWIKETLPNCHLEMDLDGNDSVIRLELSEAEQETLDKEMGKFLSSVGCL